MSDMALREALADIDDAATEYINAVLAYLDPENQYTDSRRHSMQEAAADLVAAILAARAALNDTPGLPAEARSQGGRSPLGLLPAPQPVARCARGSLKGQP